MVRRIGRLVVDGQPVVIGEVKWVEGVIEFVELKAAESGRVCWDDDPDRNMYGCWPCPECGGRHRAAYTGGKDAGLVVCGCGYSELATFADSPLGPRPTWPTDPPPVVGTAAVIVNRRGEYFIGVRSSLHDSFFDMGYPRWSRDEKLAVVYENEADARYALKRMKRRYGGAMRDADIVA